jgi:hypothetical protein
LLRVRPELRLDQAAEAPKEFLFEDAVADYGVLRRWTCFFAIKFWWYKRPTEELRSGPLLPVLSRLFTKGTCVSLRVRVADLAAEPSLYSYMWCAESQGAFFKYAMWVTRGLVWIDYPTSVLKRVPEPVSQVPAVELMDARRNDLQRIRRGRLAALPAVAEILRDKRIGGSGPVEQPGGTAEVRNGGLKATKIDLVRDRRGRWLSKPRCSPGP